MFRVSGFYFLVQRLGFKGLGLGLRLQLVGLTAMAAGVGEWGEGV